MSSLEDYAKVVQQWIEDGCSSWGVPVHQINKLAEAANEIERLREALTRTRNGIRAYLPDSRVSSPVGFERLIEIIDEALSLHKADRHDD